MPCRAYAMVITRYMDQDCSPRLANDQVSVLKARNGGIFEEFRVCEDSPLSRDQILNC